MAVAIVGDKFILEVRPPDDSFVRPVRELQYRHGDAWVLESGAGDREDGSYLAGYELARATLISGNSKVWE